MKRIFALALSLMLLLAAFACTAAQPEEPATEAPAVTDAPTSEPTAEPTETPAPTPKPLEASDLYGTWTLKTVQTGESMLAPGDFGLEMYLEFHEGGNVRLVNASYGEIFDETDPYTVEDGMLTIGGENGSTVVEYDPDEDVLRFSLADSDSTATMIFARTPMATLPEAGGTTEPETAPVDAAAIVGTWKSFRGEGPEGTVEGDLYPAAAMLTITFREDGSVKLESPTDTADAGLSWTFADGEIGLYALGETLIYSLQYEADTDLIRLYDASNDTTIWFTRTDA